MRGLRHRFVVAGLRLDLFHGAREAGFDSGATGGTAAGNHGGPGRLAGEVATAPVSLPRSPCAGAVLHDLLAWRGVAVVIRIGGLRGNRGGSDVEDTA